MREVILDTETTGLDVRNGDRLIELGCIEIVDRTPTGREFHRYINPEGRPVHPDAERIHGISSPFLADKPLFANVVDEFLAFIGEATLVIHNAPFDVGFLNAELERVKRPVLALDRIIDTLALARRKHPAGPNSLDALCKRYGIDNSDRTKHGAIVDSLLLAKVYVELLGERQRSLILAGAEIALRVTGAAPQKKAAERPAPLPPRLGPAEIEAHQAFIEQLGPNSIWKRFAAG